MRWSDVVEQHSEAIDEEQFAARWAELDDAPGSLPPSGVWARALARATSHGGDLEMSLFAGAPPEIAGPMSGDDEWATSDSGRDQDLESDESDSVTWPQCSSTNDERVADLSEEPDGFDES